MEKAIEINNLVKKYGKFTAVNDISFSVNNGGIFALLGENGAGKTTTIKALCGLTPITFGEAFVLGYNVKTEIDKVKKVINISPQETAVAPNLTVKENLYLEAKLYGIQNENEVIDKIVKDFSLQDVLNKRAKTLSGGYQRRLSIGMAMITQPKLLFLDEPTLGLDVRTRRELWKTLLELKKTMTIVLTTHYIEEASALADDLIIMKNGNILFNGTESELKIITKKDNIEDAFLEITGEDYE